jgi:hypothetical protein
MRRVINLKTPVFLMLVLFLVGACSPSKDKAAAAAATDEFHRRFNRSAFGDIYDQAEPGVKAMGPKGEFLASMEAMRQGQGAVVQAKELAVNYNYSTDGNMVKLLYEVTYEKGVAKEEFIWTIANGRGILHSYRFLGPPANR